MRGNSAINAVTFTCSSNDCPGYLSSAAADQAEIVDAAFLQLQENTQNAAAIAKETLRQLEVE